MFIKFTIKRIKRGGKIKFKRFIDFSKSLKYIEQQYSTKKYWKQ